MKHFKHRASGHTATYDNGIFTLDGIQHNVASEPDPELWEEVKPEKPKVPTWEDLEEFNGWFITLGSNVAKVVDPKITNVNRKVYPTKHHAEAALAEAQLLQLRDSKFYRNGWKPYARGIQLIPCVVVKSGDIVVEMWGSFYHLFSFQNVETADRFATEQRELLEIWVKKFD